MKPRLAIALMCLPWLAPSLLWAQTAPNYLSKDRRTIGMAFASCIADRHPDIVQTYVDQLAGIEQRKKLGEVFTPDCFPKELASKDYSSLRLHSDGLLYNFAEIMLKRTPSTLPSSFDGIPELSNPEPLRPDDYTPGERSREQHAVAVEESNRRLVMLRIGECAVRNKPALARSLLSTEIGSVEENASIGALAPVIGSCISGGSIKLIPEHIRGAIALNLYRLLNAAAGMKKAD